MLKRFFKRHLSYFTVHLKKNKQIKKKDYLSKLLNSILKENENDG